MTTGQPPEVPDWLRRAVESTQQASEIMRHSVSSEMLASIRRLQMISPPGLTDVAHMVKQFEAVRPSLQRTIESIQANQRVIEGIQQLWRRYSPDNWHDAESDHVAIADFVVESGIPLVWVPQASIIDALAAADGDSRYEVLVSLSALVLEDLEAGVANARGAEVPGHADACDFAAEAIAAARDGHWTAAQSLAASGIGQVVHGLFGYPLFGGLGKAYKKFRERDIEESTMTVLKAALLEVCTVRALTDVARAETQPFNRHGTQHGDRRFFSQASALGGLLLLVGWVREFAWLAAEGLLSADDGHDDE